MCRATAIPGTEGLQVHTAGSSLVAGVLLWKAKLHCKICSGAWEAEQRERERSKYLMASG